MLLAIALILLVLWIIGLLTHVFFFGFLHVLLVVAIILFVVHFFRRRRV